MTRRQWDYICCDCGRKLRDDEKLCPRCVKNGLPGDRVDRICCNTCIHVREVDPSGLLMCSKDEKCHELGDRCNKYIMMESNVPLYELNGGV
jgi:hypothetical protein